jgi:hypothetical protein
MPKCLYSSLAFVKKELWLALLYAPFHGRKSVTFRIWNLHQTLMRGCLTIRPGWIRLNNQRELWTAFHNLLFSSHTRLELSSLKPKWRFTALKRCGWLNRKWASLLPAAILKSLLQQTFQVAAKLREGLYVPAPLGKQKTLPGVPAHELSPSEHSPSWQSDGRSATREILRLCGARRFIAVFTRALHWSLSWVSSSHSEHTVSSSFIIHFHILLLSILMLFVCNPF